MGRMQQTLTVAHAWLPKIPQVTSTGDAALPGPSLSIVTSTLPLRVIFSLLKKSLQLDGSLSRNHQKTKNNILERNMAGMILLNASFPSKN